MDAHHRIVISVERRRGVEQLELRAGHLHIGSGAHCDVRLAPDEAASEQLLLTDRPDGVSVRNLNLTHTVLLDQAPLTQALITGAALLEISGVKLSLQVLPAEPVVDKTRSTLKSARQLAMLVAVLVGYYVVLTETPASTAFDRSVPAPELFAAQRGGECRFRTAATARAYAREQLVAAEVKQERFPYSTRDGMLAVPLFDGAYACFMAGADEGEAQRVRATRERLVRTLQDDLRTHQLRLEWSLGRHRYPAAAQEVTAIREFVQGRTDAHAQWIAAVSAGLRAAIN
jgi:hypothetical protein